LRPTPGVLAGVLGQINPTLWLNLRRSWEALNNRWQQQVLNYSRQNQFDLLKQLGVSQPDWTALGQLSAAVIASLGLFGAAWSLWQRHRPQDAWSRQRGQVLRELQALGLREAAPHQSPGAWAQLLQERFGEAAEPAARLLREQEAARYGRSASAQPPRWRERRRWLAAFRAACRPCRG